jgi:hypothetical protein
VRDQSHESFDQNSGLTRSGARSNADIKSIRVDRLFLGRRERSQVFKTFANV